MKHILVLAFLLCIWVCNISAQQKINFTPLDDADTSVIPIKSAFKGKLGNIKIMGLGEATHGDKTTFAFNFNMVKYLVTDEGFRTLFTEGPNILCVPFDNFIKSNGDR